MKLMMYIGNDLIEAIPLEVARVPKPGYVGQFKRNLKVKYKDLISKCKTPPEFLVTIPVTENNPADNCSKS